jgi:hypothetical protein
VAVVASCDRLARPAYPAAGVVRVRSAGAAFFARLNEIRADAERRMASGETGPWRPDVPERPLPWEVDTLKGPARPGSLSDSLRKMGLL